MFGCGFGLAATRILIASFQCETSVLAHPTRLACTGKIAGPSLYHLLEVLGKDKVMQRLQRALTVIRWERDYVRSSSRTTGLYLTCARHNSASGIVSSYEKAHSRCYRGYNRGNLLHHRGILLSFLLHALPAYGNRLGKTTKLLR